MTRVSFRTELFAGQESYVSFCPELHVSSFGATPEDAKRSLREAVEAFLEGCADLGTLDDILSEAGFESVGETWSLRQRIKADSVAIVK